MKTGKRIATLLTVLLCGLLLAGVALAQGSTHYGLTWRVSGSGGSSQSAHFALSGTGGQAVAGAAFSDHYRLGGGFWYGFGTPSQPGYQMYLPKIAR